MSLLCNRYKNRFLIKYQDHVLPVPINRFNFANKKFQIARAANSNQHVRLQEYKLKKDSLLDARLKEEELRLLHNKHMAATEKSGRNMILRKRIEDKLHKKFTDYEKSVEARRAKYYGCVRRTHLWLRDRFLQTRRPVGQGGAAVLPRNRRPGPEGRRQKAGGTDTPRTGNQGAQGGRTTAVRRRETAPAIWVRLCGMMGRRIPRESIGK